MDDATYLSTTTPCPCGDGSCNSCDDNGRVPVGYWSAEAQEARWAAERADADATLPAPMVFDAAPVTVRSLQHGGIFAGAFSGANVAIGGAR